MSQCLCGVFPPRDDIHQEFSNPADDVSSCIRSQGHPDDHMSRKSDGSFVAWVNDLDFKEIDEEDHHYLWWGVEDKDAQEILAEESR